MRFNLIESFKKSQIILKNRTRICKKYMSPGSAKANRREPKSCLGRVSNVKSGCFVICTIAWPIKARPSLELKTRPRFCLVSLSLSMMSLMLGTFYQTRYFRSAMAAWFSWQGMSSRAHSLHLVYVWMWHYFQLNSSTLFNCQFILNLDFDLRQIYSYIFFNISKIIPSSLLNDACY